MPGLALLQKLRGNFFVQSYVKAKLLTHDRERQTSFTNDPLITRSISVNILLEMHEAAERVVADARAISIPTQLLISGNDFVVDPKPQHDFFVNLRRAHQGAPCLPGASSTTPWARPVVPPRAHRGPALHPRLLRCIARTGRSRRRPHHGLHARRIGSPSPSPLPALRRAGLYWAGLSRQPGLWRMAVGGHRAWAQDFGSIPARRSTTSIATSLPAAARSGVPSTKPILKRWAGAAFASASSMLRS